MDKPRFKQPELTNEFGTRFYGRAKTATGEFWWYEEPLSDGTIKRHALMPALPSATKSADGE